MIAKTGLLFQNSKLFMYVLLSLVMSGYDAVATMEHIRRGVAAEGNPFMESLIQKNAVLFFFVKMLLTAFGLMICYTYSHLRTARIGIRFVVGIYSLVCLYHVMIVMFG
ncbi:MAG TPA: DUF5658 family protein [Blastocatellia bacterium]